MEKKRKEYLKQKKEEDINALEEKIESLEKMDTTIDESIAKIMKIKNIIN